MFATLKYQNSAAGNGRSLVDVRRSTKPRARGPHLACTACHSKKVKCSGGQDGCERCRARGLRCAYVKQNRAAQPLVHDGDHSTELTPADTPAYSNRDVPNSPSGAAPSQHGSHESSIWQTPDWEPRSETAPSQERQSVLHDKSASGPSDWTSWGHQMQSIEDWMPFTESRGTSTESAHGGAMVSGSDTRDPPVVPDATLESADDSSRQPREAWGLCEYSDAGEQTRTTSSRLSHLHHQRDYIRRTQAEETSSIMEHDLVNASSPQQEAYAPADEPVSKDVAEPGGLIHIIGPRMVHSCLQSPGTSSPASTASSSTCLCTQRVLQVLETFQIDNHKFSPSSFDRILGLKKKTIDVCTLTLDCPNCIATSAFVMLLIVICEKLLVSFEAWSTRYRGRRPTTPRSDSEDEDGERTRTFFLGMYEVTLGEERCSLLRALAMVQLRRLTRVVGNLMNVATSQDWQSHQLLLNSFRDRLHSAAATLAARF